MGEQHLLSWGLLAGEVPGPARAAMTSIFLMANGASSRFPGKHLKLIGGEPIISRTIKKLHQYPYPVYLVAHDPDILACRNGCHAINPGPVPLLAESIEATAPYWTNRTVILLGDVTFTDRALEFILSVNRLAFVGSCRGDRIKKFHERYALVFTKDDEETILSSIKGLKNVGVPRFNSGGLNKLACAIEHPMAYPPLLRLVNKIPEMRVIRWNIGDWIYFRYIEHMPWKARFIELDDPDTEDIDTPEDYAAYLERIQ
jgi:hypothetical protein